MNPILKSAFYIVCGLACLNASDYARNDQAITRFAQTLANVDAQEIFSVLDEYFKYNPAQKNLHPKGVPGSKFLCPLPGQKGEMDPTLTLLRMDPQNNFTVAEAQFRYAISRNSDSKSLAIVEEYQSIIDMDKTEISDIEAKWNQTIEIVNKYDSALVSMQNAAEEALLRLQIGTENASYVTTMLTQLIRTASNAKN